MANGPHFMSFPSRLAPAFLLLVALLAACGDDSASPAPPGPPSPSPVPTDVRIDLPQADRLLQDGFFEAAIDIYSAAVVRGSAEERRQSLWRLARLRYQRDEMKAAQETAQAFLDEGAGSDENQALLLLGMAASARGDNAAARRALESYVKADGPATPYALLRLAGISAAGGEFGRAIDQLQIALLAGLPGAVEARARFSLAADYEDAGRAEEALATYRQIADEGEAGQDRGEALWRLARLAGGLGDQETANAALAELVRTYPWHARSMQAVTEPQPVPVDVAPRERALVLFRQRANDAATEAWTDIAGDAHPAEAGEAHYYLGILAERRYAPDEALAEYEQSISLLSGGANAGVLAHAYWDRGTVLESAGRTDEAVDSYTAAADASSAWEGGPEALFRAGLLRFAQGRPGDASLLWIRYQEAAPDAEGRARAAFWLARAHLGMGDRPEANEFLSAAANAAPLDYYGLRAADIVRGETRLPAPGDVTPEATDWAAAERALAGWAGPEDTLASDLLLHGPAWQRAMELLHAGLLDEAEEEFRAVIEASSGKLWLLYRIAQALSREGLFSLSARAAARILEVYQQAPPELMALAYPAAYLDLATEAARPNGFSPLLLLSLVRQESMYEPEAVSGAGAMGLTQVMPATAAEIADQLDEDGFENLDLLRPNVSLRFGAYYLGEQVKLFDGEIGPALAAYNGGPGNASRWRAAAGEDPDLFLETINFSETRAYVELVLENYSLYLYAYGFAPEPSMALR